MENITTAQQESITGQLAYLLSISGEKETGTVLSKAYCEFLPNKQQWQGDMIAKYILECIGRYQFWYEIASADPKTFAVSYLQSLIKDLPVEEQCEFLHRFALGMDAFESAEGEPAPYAGDGSEAERDFLLLKAAAKITDSAPAEPLAVLSEEENRAVAILNWRSGEHNRTAWSTLTLYNTDWETDATVEQFALASCQEQTLEQLSYAAEKGYFTNAQVNSRHQAAAMVTKALLVGFAAAGTTAAVLFAGSIIAAIAAGCTALLIARTAVRRLNCTAAAMMEETDMEIAPLKLSIPEMDIEVQQQTHDYSAVNDDDITSTVHTEDYLPEEVDLE